MIRFAGGVSRHAPILAVALASGGCRHATDELKDGVDSAAGVECAAGEVLDGATCVPEACGVGMWGNLPVDDATVYVVEGGTGDGTESSPMGSIQAAVDLAGGRGGGLVAVAAGTYLETPAMGDRHDGVLIVGRCVSLVTVDGHAGPAALTLAVSGGGADPHVRVASLTVTGGIASGVWVSQGELSMSDVEVTANSLVGVYAWNARVTLEGVRVTETRPEPAGDYGYGVLVRDGARLTAHRSLIDGNSTYGLYARDAGSTVEITDTVISGTENSLIGAFSGGVMARLGASVVAVGSLIEGNAETGLMSYDEGTVVDLLETEVRNTASAPEGGYGRGAEVGYGGRLTAERCWFVGNTEAAILVGHAGSRVDLLDVAIEQTRRGRMTGIAVGVAVQRAARVSLVGTFFSDTDGPAVFVASGGRLECSACDIEGSTLAGVVVAGGRLDLSSSAIRDTAPDPEWGGGMGAYSTNFLGKGSMNLASTVVGPHPYAAIWLDGDGSYQIEDSTLFGSEGVEVGGWPIHGNAVFAERGVSAWDGTDGLRLARNTFTDASEVGVLLDGATAQLEDNTWSRNGIDVWQQRCADTTPLTDADLVGVPNWEICPDGNLLTDVSLQFDTLYLPEVEPL